VKKLDDIAISKGYFFDQKASDRVRKFVETFCKQSKGDFAGQPLKLLPWQQDFIQRLYGWKRPDGTRRYRHCSVWCAKKNGKTTALSALALYHLVADNEPGAEVYIVANDQQQAGICFGEAANMVEQSPLLAKKLEVVRSTKRIAHNASRSIMRALSSEKAGKHGYNASCLIWDELAFQADRELWDILRYSTANRRQPLTISISTAGYNREGIGYEQYQYAKGVLEGKIEDLHFLPVIYEADPNGDFRDRKQWAKANPSLGTTVHETDLDEASKEAEREPRKEANFRTLRLNQWVGVADQWISTPTWDACGEPFNAEDLHGLLCWIGLDLARKHDLAAYVLLFHLDSKYFLLPRFFIPKDTADRKEQIDHVPYRSWANRGLVTLTDGDVIDYAFIRASIKKDAEQFDIQEIGYDPYNAELLCNQQLAMEDGLKVVEIRQTFQHLAPATAQFERLLKEKRIRHGGNEVLRWQAGNVAVRQDPNLNIMVDKLRSQSRIDGISASIMALSRQMATPMDFEPRFSVM
jgi:phage terminase large subunit-like protein